jgi:4-hydroxy-2-oxoheptanedioate aldolase
MDIVREAVSAGRPVISSWVALGSTVGGELMGKAGYDCVILDTQHGGVGWGDVLPMIQALELGGTPTLVRVGWNDQAQIMRALDLGALGVVVPMVSTPEDALMAAQAVRYPPNGVRSYGPVRSYYSADAKPVDPLCFVMIETAQAMENLDAIAATPGVDGLLIGPVDLALSLGLGVVLSMNDVVLAAVDRVVDACRRHNRISASATISVAYARTLVDHGIQLVAQGSDSGFIRRSAASELEQMRAWQLE